MPAYRRNRQPVERLFQVDQEQAQQEMDADGVMVFTQSVDYLLPPYGYDQTGFVVKAAAGAGTYAGWTLSSDRPHGITIRNWFSYDSVNVGMYPKLTPAAAGLIGEVDLDKGATSFDFGLGFGSFGIDMFTGHFASPTAANLMYCGANTGLCDRLRGDFWLPPFMMLLVSRDVVNSQLSGVIRIAFGPPGPDGN